jgi:hypothetical protein
MQKIILFSSLLFSFLLFPISLFAANPGDVIITEIMQNPNEVTDANGEWIEIYNTTNKDINLNNWTIKDNGTNEHIINAQLIIPAKGFLVLGRNVNSSENGNYICHYQFASFYLSNSDDEIILLDENGTEIDRVEYDGGTVWPDPEGVSMTLINFTFDNNDGSSWTSSQARQGSYSGETGDLGSPGTLGVEQQLPVRLVGFSINLFEDGILVKWQTGLEINNLGFKIQRSLNSDDNFETISNLIPGRGNSVDQVSYSFVDQNVSLGQNYFYRIVDIGYDGFVKYHPSLSIYCNPKTKPDTFSIISIYPNPFFNINSDQILNMQLNVPEPNKEQQATISLFTLLGKKISEYKIDLIVGKMNYKKQLPQYLAAGRYFIQVQFGNQIDRKSLLVLK